MRKMMLWTLVFGLCVLGTGTWAQDAQRSQTRDNGTPRCAAEAVVPGWKSLTTTFLSNNGQDGNMFDVTAATTITIQGFDINTCDTGSTLVEVYYKAGTSVGYDQNAAAWTFLGSALVSPAGSDNPTSLPVGGLTIPAGATYGLYLTTTGGGCGFNYTDGTTDYSNSDLTIHNGYGKSYPFGDTYQPRIWNGTIYYTAGAGYDLSFFDDAGTSQLCVNSTTGAWKWNVLKGTKAGQSYSATGIVQKIASGFMIYSKPAQTYWALKLQYVSANHTALGYFRYPLKGVVSNLMDSNTLNDPPCY